MNIAFVGSGVMAEVMISGLLGEGGMEPGLIRASGPRPARAAELREAYGIHATTDNLEAVAEADLVVLSVKPQTLPRVLPEIRRALREGQLVMSIVAGARIRSIAGALGHPAVVRCIPSLPCRIRRGLTVWTAAPEVGPAAREEVRRILRTMGREIYVSDEPAVDRATALGTAPAIIAQLVKALEDAATFIGEPRALARRSVLETMLGTAEMMLAADLHPAELIDSVTSPGGTTSRALHVLQHGRFSAILTDAIDAALKRTVEMGDQLDEAMKAAEE